MKYKVIYESGMSGLGRTYQVVEDNDEQEVFCETFDEPNANLIRDLLNKIQE